MESYLEILPENVVNKIMLYNSHPVADLFKKEFEDDLDFHSIIFINEEMKKY